MSTQHAEDESSPLALSQHNTQLFPKEMDPSYNNNNDQGLELPAVRTAQGTTEEENQEILTSIEEDTEREERGTESTEARGGKKVPVHRRVSLMLNSKAENALNLDDDLER